MVVGVADALKLNLFPALQRLFDKYLRSKRKGTLGQLAESCFIGADATAQAAQCISRANHDWIADSTCSCQRIVHILNSMAHGNFQVHLGKLLHKEVAVFGVHDSFYAGTQHLDAVLLEHTLTPQLGTTVQCSLATERQQDAVGALLTDDFGHEMGVHRQEINLVSNSFRSLDGRNVRVHEHALDALFAQSLQRLRATVVELAGLADLQGS